MENENDNGRNDLGQFTPANHFTRAGVPNKSTIDLAAIRNAIVNAFNECGGPEIMAEIAKNDPVNFVKIIVSALPRSDLLEFVGESRTLTVNVTREHHEPTAEERLEFVQRCMYLAEGGTVAIEHVTEAMDCVEHAGLLPSQSLSSC